MFALARDALYAVVFHVGPRVANVIIFILLGRIAGPDEAGIFTLAATYLLILSMAMRGMDDLIVRQIAREPSHAPRYLTNFLLVRVAMAAVLNLALMLLLVQFSNYREETVATILILSLSLIPDSISYLGDSILTGLRQFSPPAIIWSGSSLFKLIGGLIIIFTGGTVQHIAVVWLVGSILGCIFMLIMAIRHAGYAGSFNLRDWRPLTSNWQTMPIFVLLTTLAVIETQFDTVILSGLHGESMVAWFGAATTVAYGLVTFSQAYRMAIYPRMSHQAKHSTEGLWRLYNQSFRTLGIFVIPVVAGIIILAPKIVPLVFGDQFQPTISVLQILIVAVIFIFLTEPNIRMMLVNNHQQKLLWFLLAVAISNIVVNLVLAPRYGANGSAVARVSTAMLFFVLTFLFITQNRSRLISLRLLIKPLVAAVVMVVVVFLTRQWPIVITILLGATTYFAVLFFIGGISTDEAHMVIDAIKGRLDGSTSKPMNQ